MEILEKEIITEEKFITQEEIRIITQFKINYFISAIADNNTILQTIFSDELKLLKNQNQQIKNIIDANIYYRKAQEAKKQLRQEFSIAENDWDFFQRKDLNFFTQITGKIGQNLNENLIRKIKF